MRRLPHLSRKGVEPRPRLTVALINNMPDAALLAAERQFTGLLAEAAGKAIDLRVRLCAFEATPRGGLARAVMSERYSDVGALMALGADALIITGAEPQAAQLRDEPYWPELADLIDWARGGVRSALFSCLAAHAAVLHLDGIERRRLPAKRTGVFTFVRQNGGPLTPGLGDDWATPHSRWNALAAEELTAHGYQVLAASPEAGVDLFTRDLGSLFVFLQGHPEYDADSLFREYRRDLGRCQRGELAVAPPPQHYFTPAVEAALASASSCGERERLAARGAPVASWRGHAVRLYRNWLDYVAEAKAAGSNEQDGATPPVAGQQSQLQPL